MWKLLAVLLLVNLTLINCAPSRSVQRQQSGHQHHSHSSHSHDGHDHHHHHHADSNNKENDKISAAASQSGAGSQGQRYTPPGTPQISWGKCPQLEPTMEEKMSKANVITKCLEVTPIPNNITRESIELHREQVAGCALQMEGWFNSEGNYRFDKAEKEIKSKRLTSQIEEKVLNYHSQCKVEAEEKFPSSTKQLIPQIQLYQACMDYFISEVCGIEVSLPNSQF